MELKLTSFEPITMYYPRSNRTFMELKLTSFEPITSFEPF